MQRRMGDSAFVMRPQSDLAGDSLTFWRDDGSLALGGIVLMMLPAVCDNCGSFFPSSIQLENSRHIAFSNCTSGPCPRCGGMGHIPDGVYNFIGDTIELLSGPGRTVSELERLADILNRARQQDASPEQVAEAIEIETPGLSLLKDILPKSRDDLYKFIQILLMTISILLPLMKKAEPPKVEVNVVINQVVDSIYQQPAPNPTAAPRPPSRPATVGTQPRTSDRKTGRNEPCPCGSGKKYKKCCLNEKQEMLTRP